MKKKISLAVIVVSLSMAGLAQPIPEKNAEGYASGQVTLPDNSVVTGSIKDNIRKKGEITLVKDGKKTKYQAASISSVQVAGAHYITHNNTFYEVIWEGKTLSLYRKASNSSAIQYNGSEPVAAVTGEGDIDDLFVKANGATNYQLLTTRNSKEVLGRICSTCVHGLDASRVDAEAIKKAVMNCDNCK